MDGYIFLCVLDMYWMDQNPLAIVLISAVLLLLFYIYSVQ